MDIAVYIDERCECSEQVTTIEYYVRMVVHVARFTSCFVQRVCMAPIPALRIISFFLRYKLRKQIYKSEHS